MMSRYAVICMASGLLACAAVANAAPLSLEFGTGKTPGIDNAYWGDHLRTTGWAIDNAYPVTRTQEAGDLAVTAPANPTDAKIYTPWYWNSGDNGGNTIDLSDQTQIQVTIQKGPTWSGWETGGPGSWNFKLYFQSPDQGQSGFHLTLPATMQTFTFNLSAPDEVSWNGKPCDWTKLDVVAVYASGTGTLDYKIASIVTPPVPEPASLGLLGLASLAGLRRRRS